MTARTPERILLVFVKAPVPGSVKTRLAEDLGPNEAARIYRELGLRTVRQLESGQYRTVIYYDPPESLDDVRDWLGGEGRRFLAQPAGDLGARLLRAFEWGFSQGELVCVVGTDVPKLEAKIVDRAFSLLDEDPATDAVLGPALDGGYYLLALRRPASGLFEGIPWSSDRVLRETLQRAEELGLSVRSLQPLADVDRAEDLPSEYRPR